MVAPSRTECRGDDNHSSSGSENESELNTPKTTTRTSSSNLNTVTMLISSLDESGTNAQSDEDLNANYCTERRFVWFQKEEEQKLRSDATNVPHYEYTSSSSALPASSRLDSKDFKDKVRAGGGAKGRTGSTDFTRGKNAFVRPCTVGWKSQNQPLMKGGGNRTPRQKG
jgi:hypothetical protein